MFTGSTAGGTFITINGDGFNPSSTLVKLGSLVDATITYNQITFKTSSNPAGDFLLSINVNQIESACKQAPNCTYEFSSISAPTISAISPTSVSGQTTLTISGSNFGSDISKLNVQIGTESCVVLSASNTQLTCSLAGLSIGLFTANVNLLGTF